MSDGASGALQVEQLSIVLGHGASRFEALDGVSFRAEPGEFVCVLGAFRLRQVDPARCARRPSAAGARARFVSTRDAASKGHRRSAGLVFQHHTLFPWKRVQDNVAFGLKMKGVPARERLARARELLQLVWARRLRGALSDPAFRRHAAARRDRTGADQPPAAAC